MQVFESTKRLKILFKYMAPCMPRMLAFKNHSLIHVTQFAIMIMDRYRQFALNAFSITKLTGMMLKACLLKLISDFQSVVSRFIPDTCWTCFRINSVPKIVRISNNCDQECLSPTLRAQPPQPPATFSLPFSPFLSYRVPYPPPFLLSHSLTFLPFRSSVLPLSRPFLTQWRGYNNAVYEF
jgi:hypothetical protein